MYFRSYFLVLDTTLASDSPLSFTKNLLERIKRSILITDNKIKDEKLQYDIKRDEATISAFSSGKIDKYQYHTVE